MISSSRFINGKLVERRIEGVLQPVSNLGDKVAAIATPIARALKMPCIDPVTNQLKPESGCGKMKARLNAGMPLAAAIKLRIQGK